eukprot:CAMPEP_0118870094 /NCGR_PEP_ID=MMETSP1163-20130328/13190_1 /TAXON_ID=124430 /ORGANISM="Phaeomonas parva, Strain CCMP2877" /LENGTH=126 /DNA_ID=CAMNT_0006805045 /DNA_START=8 /DNA_END=388 /DNA_ORIENTATION=-
MAPAVVSGMVPPMAPPIEPPTAPPTAPDMAPAGVATKPDPMSLAPEGERGSGIFSGGGESFGFQAAKARSQSTPIISWNMQEALGGGEPMEFDDMPGLGLDLDFDDAAVQEKNEWLAWMEEPSDAA